MTDDARKHVYIGPNRLAMSLRSGMAVRVRPHPRRGTSPLVRVGFTRIELESGDIWRVRKGQVVPRDLAVQIFGDDGSA